MKKLVLILLMVLLVQAVIAEDIAESKSELVLQVSSLPEAKLIFNQSFIFPFLQADNALMSGNNIRFTLTGQVTPVSLDGILKTVFTPIAFLEFSAGGLIGTGWPVNLFGKDLYGNGLNLSVENNEGENKEVFSGNGFDSVLLKAWAGGTFQFDFAAIFPGDWNHVVMQSYHEINYQSNSKASAGQGWYYEADEGENNNGFNYYGNFILGYQMPLVPYLKMIAFMAEMDLFLYDTPGRNVWGDDLIRWHFANILQFSITDNFGFGIITQFRTRRNFTNYIDADAKQLRKDHGTPLMHYQSRILDTNNPLRVEFYRVAGIFSYTF